MKKLVYQVIFIIVVILYLPGCATSYYNQGNLLYKNLNYNEAIVKYTMALSIKDIPDAKIELADSYRKMDNLHEAENWYSMVVSMPEAKPVHQLYYAHILKRMGKNEEAEFWYNNYLQLMPADDEAKRALGEIKSMHALKVKQNKNEN